MDSIESSPLTKDIQMTTELENLKAQTSEAAQRIQEYQNKWMSSEREKQDVLQQVTSMNHSLQQELEVLQDELAEEKKNSHSTHRELVMSRQHLQEVQDEKEEMRRESERLKEEVRTIRRENLGLKAKVEANQTDHTSSDTDAKYRRTIAKLEDDLLREQAQTAEVEGHLSRLRRELESMSVLGAKRHAEWESLEALRDVLQAENKGLLVQVEHIQSTKDEQVAELYHRLDVLQKEYTEEKHTLETRLARAKASSQDSELRARRAEDHLESARDESTRLRQQLNQVTADRDRLMEAVAKGESYIEMLKVETSNQFLLQKSQAKEEELRTQGELEEIRLAMEDMQKRFTQAEIKAKQNEDAMESKIQSLKDELQSAEQCKSRLESEKKALRQENASLETHTSELKKLYENKTKELRESIQWENDTHRQAFDQMKQKLEEMQRERSTMNHEMDTIAQRLSRESEAKEKLDYDLQTAKAEVLRLTRAVEVSSSEIKDLKDRLLQEEETGLRLAEKLSVTEEEFKTEASGRMQMSAELQAILNEKEDAIREAQTAKVKLDEHTLSTQAEITHLTEMNIQYESELEELQRQAHTESQAQMEALDRAVEEYRQRLADANQEHERITDSLNHRIETMDAQLEHFRSKASVVQNKNDELNLELSSVVRRYEEKTTELQVILETHSLQLAKERESALQEKQDELKATHQTLVSEFHVLKEKNAELELELQLARDAQSRLEIEKKDAEGRLAHETNRINQEREQLLVHVEKLLEDNTKLVEESAATKKELSELRGEIGLHKRNVVVRHEEKDKEETYRQTMTAEVKDLHERIRESQQALHDCQSNALEARRSWIRELQGQGFLSEKLQEYSMALNLQTDSINSAVQTLIPVITSLMATASKTKAQDAKMMERFRMVIQEGQKWHEAYSLLKAKHESYNQQHHDELHLVRMENASLKSLLSSANAAIFKKANSDTSPIHSPGVSPSRMHAYRRSPEPRHHVDSAQSYTTIQTRYVTADLTTDKRRVGRDVSMRGDGRVSPAFDLAHTSTGRHLRSVSPRPKATSPAIRGPSPSSISASFGSSDRQFNVKKMAGRGGLRSSSTSSTRTGYSTPQSTSTLGQCRPLFK